MKLRKSISRVLKMIGYILGSVGVFFALGSVGAFENGNITGLQFFNQMIISGFFILATFVIYILREYFKYKYIDNFEKCFK